MDHPAIDPGGGYFAVMRRLWPTLWQSRTRVLVALALVVAAKLAGIGVPLLLKALVDGLNSRTGAATVPVLLLLAYAGLRLSTALFQELRGLVFARVLTRTTRIVTLRVFEHLHALSLRFHLDRRTGGVTRDVERGMTSVADLVDWSIYMILPIAFEVAVVAVILMVNYDLGFTVITLATLAVYAGFTWFATEWRLQSFRAMNEADTEANAHSVDSLLNYETVKYFNSERHELERFDGSLRRLEASAITSLKTASVLNIGQASIIAAGLGLLLWRAAAGVVAGQMSVGDLVLVNAFLIQLAVPLNSLGMLYREVRQALANIARLFALLDAPVDVRDVEGASALVLAGGGVQFRGVAFGYQDDRAVLKDISLTIPAGRTLAAVGTSGAGKSTLARLLYRFYDVDAGQILVDGQDIRTVTQASLRAAIGVVPQDTVLFNETIHYNIAYGRAGASRDEVVAAAKSAHIHDFILRLPKAYETNVGERGLKLSGGEKQRIAIARTLLKNPAVLVFDEATSALDTRTERIIQGEIAEIARARTTLIIAHRLSTIVDADEIIVLDHGRIVERGTHASLLARGGHYATLWAMQQHSAAPIPRHEPEHP